MYFAGQAQAAVLQNHKIRYTTFSDHNLFRVTNFPRNLLSQFDQSFFGQIIEKANVIKKSFIGLFTILPLQNLGQRFQNFIMSIILKTLFNPIWLFDKIGNFRFHLMRNKILFAHPMKYFEFLLFLLLVLSNWVYESTDIIYVISKSNTTESLYKYKHNRFIIISRSYISKPDSKHNIGPPIVPPNVLYKPLCIINAKLNFPILCFINIGHQIKQDG